MGTIWLKYSIGLTLIFVTNSRAASSLAMYIESKQNAVSPISDVSTRMEPSLRKDIDDPANGIKTVDGKNATVVSMASYLMGRDVVATAISPNTFKSGNVEVSQFAVASRANNQFGNGSNEFFHKKNTQRQFQTRLIGPLRNRLTDASNNFSDLCIEKFGDQKRLVQHRLKKPAGKIKKRSWNFVYRSYHEQYDTLLYCPSSATEEKNKNVFLHSTPEADGSFVTASRISQQVKYGSTTFDYETKDGNMDAEVSNRIESNPTSPSDQTNWVTRQSDSTNAISVTTEILVNEPIQLSKNWIAIREGSTVIPNNNLHEAGRTKKVFEPDDDENEPTRAEAGMKEIGSKAGQTRNLIDSTGSPDLESLDAHQFADSESRNGTDLPNENIDKQRSTFDKQEPITFLTLEGDAMEKQLEEPVCTITTMPTLRENDPMKKPTLFGIDNSAASSTVKNSPTELLWSEKIYLKHIASSNHRPSTAATGDERSKFDAFSTVGAILSGTSESGRTTSTDITINKAEDATAKDYREMEEPKVSASQVIGSTTSQFEIIGGIQFNVTKFHRTLGSAETVQSYDSSKGSKDDDFDFSEETIEWPVESMNSEEHYFSDDFETTPIPYRENYEFASWEDDDDDVVDENNIRTITAKQPLLGLINNHNYSASLDATVREGSKFSGNGERREGTSTPTVDFGAVKRFGLTTAKIVDSRRVLISVVEFRNNETPTRHANHRPAGGLPEMIFGEIRDYDDVEGCRSEE